MAVRPDFLHCYPVSFDGLAPLTPPPQYDSCTTITHVVYRTRTTPKSCRKELPFAAGGHEMMLVLLLDGAAARAARAAADAPPAARAGLLRHV